MSKKNFLKKIIPDFGDDLIVDPVDLEENITPPDVLARQSRIVDSLHLEVTSRESTIEMNRLLQSSLPGLKNELAEIRKAINLLAEKKESSSELAELREEVARLKKQLDSK